ncbi:DUF4157 domain-containing protein [Leptothrix ochracea]|uniref:eCIS core domain-containing protein n=1 Tax=Leptothrix ochracea TaxID=735331 RepID=UPI0034E22CC9
MSKISTPQEPSRLPSQTLQALQAVQSNVGQAYKGASVEAPQSEQFTQLTAMADSSPRLVTQRKLTGLPTQLKAGIESLSGMSMDHVQVHYNSSKPAQLQASAYAQGSNIHVGPGQEKHLPHEAWHVVQQAQGRVRPTVQAKGMPINDDPGLEREADVMGARAMTLETLSVNMPNIRTSSPLIQAIQRQPRDSRKKIFGEMPDARWFRQLTKVQGFIFSARRDSLLIEIDDLLIEFQPYSKIYDVKSAYFDSKLACLRALITKVTKWCDLNHNVSNELFTYVEALNDRAHKELNVLLKRLGNDDERKKPADEAEKNIKYKFDGDMASAFDSIADIVDENMPIKGKKVGCEVELSINNPYIPSTTIGGIIKTDGERGDDGVKVKSEIDVTIGVELFNIVNFKGSLGGYFEANAENPIKAVNLVSYGLYRRINDSGRIYNPFVNYMWGGAVDSSGAEKAKGWASKVEEESLSWEGAYVETGAIAGVGAEAGSDDAIKANIGVSRSSATRYTKDEPKNAYGMAGSQHISVWSGQLEVNALDGSIAYKQTQLGTAPPTIEIEGSASIKSDENSIHSDLLSTLINVKDAILKADSNLPTIQRIGKGLSDVIGDAADALTKKPDLFDQAKESMAEQLLHKKESSLSATLNIAGAIKSSGEKECEISIWTTESHELDARIIKGKMKKQNKIIGLKYPEFSITY